MPLPDRAVVVGIQAYPRFGPGGTAAALQSPIRNAQAVASWLRSTGGVSTCDLIVDSEDAAGGLPEPTKARIEEAFHRLAREAQEQKEKGHGELIGRRLYVYMSGHGWSPGVQQSCLFAANASSSETFNVHATGWLRWFQDAAHFREHVLWMDCCMDRFSSFPPGSIDKPLVPGRSTPGPSFVAFAAQRPLKAAEVLNPVTGLPDGAFTWALLDGLEGAAADPNGRVTGRSLADWLRQSVLARLPEAARSDFDIAKEPEIAAESSDLIFARETPVRRYEVVVDADRMPASGELVVYAGSPLREECRARCAGAPVRLSLAPGLYHAEHGTRPLCANFEVVADRGVRLLADVPRLLPTPRDAMFVLDYDPPDAAVEITVVDHRFAAVERGIGRLRTRLPAGLFKLRARSGRNIEDSVLLLDRDMSGLAGDIQAPARSMVAPVDGTLSSHEYQAQALHELAARGEVLRRGHGTDTSAVSLLVRTFSETGDASAALAPWSRVAVVDARGTPMLVAGDDVRDAPDRDPFAVAVKALPPEDYFLRHELDGGGDGDGLTVQQSLVLPGGWNLEVHVLRRVDGGVVDCRPRISLHMSAHGHRVSDEERRLVEVARLALADERPILGDELQQLLVRKFSNPIAGILGAHLLVLGEEAGQMFDPDLLNDVVTNLRSLVGDDHPDVEAVSLRCKDEDLRTRRTRMARAPMFERSWRMLVAASYERPRLLSDRLASRLLVPSALPPFLVWAQDGGTRRAALRQLRQAVWAPRSGNESPAGAGPPPLQQPIAAAAMKSAGWQWQAEPPTSDALSQYDRRDRRLARERVSNLGLPSNALSSLLNGDGQVF